MRKILLLAIAALMTAVSVHAQRIDCLRSGTITRGSSSYMLPVPYDFDAQKIYRVPVVLVSVPLRYMHSSAEMCDVRDIEKCVRLIAEFIRREDER